MAERTGAFMTLGIRKMMVVGLVAAVFVVANALVLAHWLESSGAIGWAGWIRREFLTGTAITILVALLILLVPAGNTVAHGLFSRCSVCNGLVSRRAKYCEECGSRV
jgi:hypothetical protein